MKFEANASQFCSQSCGLRAHVQKHGEGPLLSPSSIGSAGFSALISQVVGYIGPVPSVQLKSTLQAFQNDFELPQGSEHGDNNPSCDLCDLILS